MTEWPTHWSKLAFFALWPASPALSMRFFLRTGPSPLRSVVLAVLATLEAPSILTFSRIAVQGLCRSM